MPTLHWIGKEKVINHHMDVPFKVLEHKYHFSSESGLSGLKNEQDSSSSIQKSLNPINPNADKRSCNKIIHGDNLEALKALLPEYEGKIKCIYIDPPYNTGNEGWVYNDNVTDPKIKKWLGQVVGKESDDLSRHDKWLCMIYPRLKLLHKLLKEDGAIFISIDENEYSYLKLLCDEIFGRGNFIITVAWQKRYSRENRGIIGDAHEYIVAYAKNLQGFKQVAKKIKPTEDQTKIYKNPNNDPKGRWRAIPMTAQGYRPNQMYPIVAPKGKVHLPPEGRCWSMIESEFLRLKDENKIYFGKDNNSQPNVIRYLNEIEGFVPWSWWPSNEVGHTDEAKKEIHSFFGKTEAFDTPKPVRLINRILEIATDKQSIVLDSFAGSATTAHAVLNLNKQDGGNRKFILVEMEDYAETVTAERIKRVINGYGEIEGTGGSFDFYELGQPLFNEDGNLNEAVGTERIRNYVWYTETKTPMSELGFTGLMDKQDSSKIQKSANPKNPNSDNKHFLGNHNDTAYYFNYEPDEITTLNHEFLATMKTKAEQYVIYADNCLLTKEFMTKHHIIFKKIPRDITRF
ncbi:MAG: site-specific DNA-methyltransferase [Cytophagaceae bacterium]|nr:site-specific DNA-methyltransferase [Cytophagaceae bacterium]